MVTGSSQRVRWLSSPVNSGPSGGVKWGLWTSPACMIRDSRCTHGTEVSSWFQIRPRTPCGRRIRAASVLASRGSHQCQAWATVTRSKAPDSQSGVFGGALDGGDTREGAAQLFQHVRGRVHGHGPEPPFDQERRELAGAGAQVGGVAGPGGDQPVGRIRRVAGPDPVVVLAAVLEALAELLPPAEWWSLGPPRATCDLLRQLWCVPVEFTARGPGCAAGRVERSRGLRQRCPACSAPSAGSCGCRWPEPSGRRPPRSPSPGRSAAAPGGRRAAAGRPRAGSRGRSWPGANPAGRPSRFSSGWAQNRPSRRPMPCSADR